MVIMHRRSSAPRKDSATRLFELTVHSIAEVAQFAFSGLLMDSDNHVRWVAAQLAMDLSFYHRFTMKKNGDRDHTVNRNARKESLAHALERLHQTADMPLTDMPLVWVRAKSPRRAGRSAENSARTR
jgi:hypothetical protein